ncbi:MAG TPA: M20/M25/M40 family metallo-hydrolase [Thermoanaerobaculia bacterium]|nr:M20/M25/M40 family metallo-hydrolase [Thermoanaerobaculia bacterium]
MSVVAAPLFAQSPAERLMASALQSSQAWETLEHLTDDIGPRLSGSRNAAIAVDWTLKRFGSWGIDAHTEKVMVPHWVRGVERAEIVAPHPQRLVLTALGGSVATPESGITAEVVELGSFEELPSSNVKGKIVFFNVPMDMDLVRAGRSFEAYGKAVEYRGRGADRASAYGARAVLIRSVSSDSLRTPHTGALSYQDKVAKIPAAALAAEDAMLLHRLLAQQQRIRLHLVLTPRMLPDAESANVVAEIRGTEHADEIVLLGAHLDSWDLGTGAIDDGAGVAMVMETMRLIKASGLQPKRTIRCVLYMNEENGLRGGKQYAADHRGEKHIAAIESDAGTAAPNGFLTTLKGADLTSLEQRTRMLERVNGAKFDSAEQTGADTGPLVDAGTTGFGLMPDQRHYFDYHHSAADTLDKVDPPELVQNTAAIAALTWVLAQDGVPSPEAGRGH